MNDKTLTIICMLCLVTGRLAHAEPLIAPGRLDLRADIEDLADAGVITAPVTTWPISWQSIIDEVDSASATELSLRERHALERVRSEIAINEQLHRVLPSLRIGGSNEPFVMRTFSATPREQGELEAAVSYTGDRLSFNVNLTRAWDSQDDWRADGSYVAFAIRRWAVVAGSPERWWGPGVQGSLILSTNARPVPQIGVERISAEGFKHRWLRWIGPWTLSTFIGEMDDERLVSDAKLFGVRVTAKPLPQFEIGFSRAAQLCGNGRSCGATEFSNMLLGRDNRGRNVADEDEPGNQLAGLDGRWSFRGRPFSVYWQWVGEDTRQGGPQIGSWMRLFGAELSGGFPLTNLRHKTWFEIADTTCQNGGGGFGGNKFNCGYQHSIYKTGFRYEGLPLGYPTDTDSESLAIVSLLSGADTTSWELAARSVRVNQGPVATSQLHALSTTPASYYGIDVTHVRDLPLGRLRVRVGTAELTESATGISKRDSSVAVEWMVGYW